MAELLVVSFDRPVPDTAHKWREGEVVVIKPDGWNWGRKELESDRFVIIELPGATVEEVQSFLEEDHDEDEPIIGPGQIPNSLHRRRFVIPPGLMQAGRSGNNNRARSNVAFLLGNRKDRRGRREQGLDSRPPWPPAGGDSVI